MVDDTVEYLIVYWGNFRAKCEVIAREKAECEHMLFSAIQGFIVTSCWKGRQKGTCDHPHIG